MVKPSERLGNYEIISTPDGNASVLGSGAGGVTYRGKHIHLGTEVAIKVLIRKKNLLQRDRDAFLSEARAAASLSHPQIARILDFGESQQQHPYYVMELCAGGSLEDVGRKTGPPDGYSCIQWLLESASALAHAHQKCLFHRDIKPSNLLVALHNGTAAIKLIDFGLAEASDHTDASDSVIGTPLFVAPEQLRGQASAASDVFALGATFLWLLTGKNLSSGDVKSVIAERLSTNSYQLMLESLAPSWSSILGKMLECDPKQRLQDGSAVLAALQQTFPNHLGHPVLWEHTENFQGPASKLPIVDQWIDCSNTEWSSIWTSETTPLFEGMGRVCRARRHEDGADYDVTRYINLSPENSSLLIDQGNLVSRYAGQLGLEKVILERGDTWFSVAWPMLSPLDALSWVRQGQTASTPEILSALEPLAAALDGISIGGLEHLEIHPSMFIVSGGDVSSPLKFSLALSLPVLALAVDAGESGGTMRGAGGVSLSARFAASAYQLLSGRTVAAAAFLNARAYHAVPKLTERANRFLSSAIAGTLNDSNCQDVVRGLAYEERIPGASYTGGASMTGFMGLSGRSSTSLHLNPALSSPAQVPAIPISVTAELIPMPAVSIPVTQPPLEQTMKSKVEHLPSDSRLKAWIILGATTLVLGVLGTIGWSFVSNLPSKVKPLTQQTPTVGAQPKVEANKVEDALSKPVIPEPVRAPAVVKVPSEMPSINKALELCKEGGTIEIEGGNYLEPLILQKSISIISSPAAVFEDHSGGSNLMIVRGPIQVTLRNIQFKNSQSQVTANLESSPALLLISDGAVVRCEGCVFEGSVGNGITVTDKGSVTFSNCRIRKSRGIGVSVSSGAKVELSLSEIEESGRSGVVVSNVGSSAVLESGTRVSTSSQNGIEVSNGAMLKAKGTTLDRHQKVGLIVEGSGSFADLSSSCVISGNRMYGIGVQNSSKLSVSNSLILDNSENGIYIEKDGFSEIYQSNFKTNGKIGVYLVNGAASRVILTKSSFQGHSDSGVAIVGGTGQVTDCNFIDNKMSLFFGQGASGSATGNTMFPGPIEDALFLEGAGEVHVENNKIENSH